MAYRAVWLHCLLAGGLVTALAGACSSSSDRTTNDNEAGAAGEGGAGPDSSAGGSDNSLGGERPAAGASAGGTPAAGGAEPAQGGAGGQSLPSDDGGQPATGEAGAGGAPPDFGEPDNVDTFGCFIRSGDGGDLLPTGEIAVNVTNPVYSAACDSTWVSTNENAYTSQEVPTTLVMRRSFIIADDLGAGDFSITYKADDAIDFFLNGELIIGCTPPAENPGFCQQVCNTSAISPASLKPPGQLNTLEARLINLQSTPAGNGNFGYTALNYSVCVEPAGS